MIGRRCCYCQLRIEEGRFPPHPVLCRFCEEQAANGDKEVLFALLRVLDGEDIEPTEPLNSNETRR